MSMKSNGKRCQSANLLRRSALPTTETELKVMAALASTELSKLSYAGSRLGCIEDAHCDNLRVNSVVRLSTSRASGLRQAPAFSNLEHMEKFDRHTLDLVARAVVSGRRGYGKRLDRVADGIARLIKNRLEATEAPGAARAHSSHEGEAALPDRETLEALLNRIEKHLAMLVLAQSADDRSQTR